MFQEEICTVFLGIKLYVMLSKYKLLQREFSTYTLLKNFTQTHKKYNFFFFIQKGNLVFCVEAVTSSVQTINSKIFVLY